MTTEQPTQVVTRVHFWANRTHQRQIFTTGSDPGGYLLNAAILKNLNNTIAVSQIFNVIVGFLSGTVLTQIGSTETGVSPSFASLDYITCNFDAPITLAANTQCGFLWGTAGQSFVTVNNPDNSTYL